VLKKPLSRHALARQLRVSVSSVDRLIRVGLVPVGTRGLARLYDLKAARRLLRRRAPSSPELVEALIARQDALSRRTSARLTKIVETHVDAGDAARMWIRIVEVARTHLQQLPDDFVTHHPLEHPVALTELVDEALSELIVTDQDRARAAEPPGPPLVVPVVRRSRSLAEARAQGARLQTQYFDLKARMAEGTLVPAQDVEALASRHVITARQLLLAMPTKIGVRFTAVDRGVIHAIDAEVRQILEDLAAGVDHAREAIPPETSA
jgi:phage terminase Nu1 subunit (DNA packaging protein)